MNGKENPLIVNALPLCTDCAIDRGSAAAREREASQGNHYNSAIVCNWKLEEWVVEFSQPTTMVSIRPRSAAAEYQQRGQPGKYQMGAKQ